MEESGVGVGQGEEAGYHNIHIGRGVVSSRTKE